MRVNLACGHGTGWAFASMWAQSFPPYLHRMCSYHNRHSWSDAGAERGEKRRGKLLSSTPESDKPFLLFSVEEELRSICLHSEEISLDLT